MNALVKSAAAKLPAIFRNQNVAELHDELSAGVVAGFPIISYRGKVWRIRKAGKEENYLSPDGDAMPSIEVVLVRSNKELSKSYYDKKFEEGTNEAPTCWSANGIKPDADVPNPVAPLCAACPKNQWGSKISDNGSKGRACADVRRMAVVLAHELEEKGKDATLLLLRVPPASLNPLKDYSEKVLAPKGIPFFAVTTKVGFDPTVAHPKLTFKATRFLTDEEAEAVVALRGSEDARRILSESAEFDGAGTTGAGETTGADLPAAATAPAPAPSAPKKAKAMKPVEEEDVEIDAPAPAPAKKKTAAKPAPAPVAAVSDDEDEGEEITPPAKPVAAQPAAAGDFDELLDSLLS